MFAVSPFNFTSIGGNLPTAPAIMGNTVVWKPASTAVYSAHFIMQLLLEAGLPPGVINLVYGSGAQVGDAVLASPQLAGVHFTGSTAVFHGMWKTVGRQHRALPDLPAPRRRDRRQGLHLRPRERRRRRARRGHRPRRLRVPGAEVQRGLARVPAEHPRRGRARAGGRDDRRDQGGRRPRLLELHGRRHRPERLPRARRLHRARPKGRLEDPRRRHLRRLASATSSQPTLVETPDPTFEAHVRGDLRPRAHLATSTTRRTSTRALTLCDTTSPYALTGAVFARDRALHRAGRPGAPQRRGQLLRQRQADRRRRRPAAVRRRARLGTNDKAGSLWNLVRWVSPRTIKENLAPPTSWRYPYMATDA